MLVTKIANMVPLCWTKWLSELKKNTTTPPRQMSQLHNTRGLNRFYIATTLEEGKKVIKRD